MDRSLPDRRVTEPLSQQRLLDLADQKGQIGLGKTKARSHNAIVLDVRRDMLMVWVIQSKRRNEVVARNLLTESAYILRRCTQIS